MKVNIRGSFTAHRTRLGQHWRERNVGLNYHELYRTNARLLALSGDLQCRSARQLEVFTDPSGPRERAGYGKHRVFLPGEEVPVILDGREVGRIAVDDLLP